MDFDEIPRYNSNFMKYTNITFTIFVHGENVIDKLTGIPRHDLIAALLENDLIGLLFLVCKQN